VHKAYMRRLIMYAVFRGMSDKQSLDRPTGIDADGTFKSLILYLIRYTLTARKMLNVSLEVERSPHRANTSILVCR
jgi:hypothetical protein